MEGQRTGPAQELGLLSFVAAYVQVITSSIAFPHPNTTMLYCVRVLHHDICMISLYRKTISPPFNLNSRSTVKLFVNIAEIVKGCLEENY